MKSVWLITGMVLLGGCSTMMNSTNSLSRPSAEMFPTMKDKKKHVFYVDSLNNEQDKRIELIIGKMMEIDCNHVSLIGSVTEHTLKGWGYTYYQVNSSGDSLSTLIGCPTDIKKAETFISMPTQKLYRYNSKLPIVVYAPKDLDVSIRIWAPEQ